MQMSTILSRQVMTNRKGNHRRMNVWAQIFMGL